MLNFTLNVHDPNDGSLLSTGIRNYHLRAQTLHARLLLPGGNPKVLRGLVEAAATTLAHIPAQFPAVTPPAVGWAADPVRVRSYNTEFDRVEGWLNLIPGSTRPQRWQRLPVPVAVHVPPPPGAPPPPPPPPGGVRYYALKAGRVGLFGGGIALTYSGGSGLYQLSKKTGEMATKEIVKVGLKEGAKVLVGASTAVRAVTT